MVWAAMVQVRPAELAAAAPNPPQVHHSPGLPAQAGGSAPAAPSVPGEFRQLAARSADRHIWPRLRRYAEARKNSEQRGWAYFVLGYREYEAGDDSAAEGDLHQAAQSGISLADHAEFYLASAARHAESPAQAAAVLEGFSSRFPESPLHLRALELRAGSLIEAHEGQQALAILLAESRVRQRSSLALLLAQAYLEAGQAKEAARAFQEVYYAYPSAPQAKTAAEALTDLRDRLAADFPEPSEGLQSARAAALVKAGQFGDALKEYSALIEARPSSSSLWAWQVGKARCLLRLRRASEAVSFLSQSSRPVPEEDAERLALLVEVYAQQSDTASLQQLLSLAQSLYPQSPAYGSALSAAGAFYFRQQDWPNAARCYQVLAESFPQNEHARDAAWRLALCDYFLKEPEQALAALRDFITRYPDSPRVAAALYWLARLTEASADTSEARDLYALLGKRFVHSYYQTRAAARIQALSSNLAAERGANAPRPGSLAATLAQVIPPASTPSNGLCAPASDSRVVDSARMLQALSLKDLAAEYLQVELLQHAAAPEMRYVLSQLEAEQGLVSVGLLDAIKVAPAYPQVDFEALPKDFWDLLFPRSYWALVQRQARANRVDPYLVMGLIRQESAFNPRAISSANARGLMQILPSTASRSRRASSVRAVGQRLYDPAYNVRFGCAYLRGLLAQFDGRWELAVAAYHAGDFRVKDWLQKFPVDDPVEFLEAIPIPATRAYVEAVLRDQAIYKELMAGSPKFLNCGR